MVIISRKKYPGSRFRANYWTPDIFQTYDLLVLKNYGVATMNCLYE